MKRAVIGLGVGVFASAVAGLSGCARSADGHAPVPAAFEAGLTFDQAVVKSRESGKPVLVFATADWCGPCQSFKRGALSEQAATDAILAATEPVYLDVDDHPEVVRRIATMGASINGIPTMVLIRDEKAVAHRAGVMSTRELTSWLGEVR